MKIENREIIYNACKQIEKECNNVYIHDPSEFIKEKTPEAMILAHELKAKIYDHFTNQAIQYNSDKLNEIVTNIVKNNMEKY